MYWLRLLVVALLAVVALPAPEFPDADEEFSEPPW
jgi:hypothetical protein